MRAFTKSRDVFFFATQNHAVSTPHKAAIDWAGDVTQQTQVFWQQVSAWPRLCGDGRCAAILRRRRKGFARNVKVAGHGNIAPTCIAWVCAIAGTLQRTTNFSRQNRNGIRVSRAG